MHVPNHFEENNIETLHQLMQAHPLACVVNYHDKQLQANHIPFLIDAEASSLGVLRGHVARANPLWKMLSAEDELLIIFQGPENYISPSWYPSKHQHGKAVPTWNYAVVHAYGSGRAIEDSAWLMNLVSELTDVQETSRALPWKVSDAPTEFIDKQLSAIVGIEINIKRLSGKWKTSQNRSKPDQIGVIAGLESLASDSAQEMVLMMGKL